MRVPIAEDRTTEVMRHGRAAIDWPAALTTLQKVGVQRLNQGDARAREGGA